VKDQFDLTLTSVFSLISAIIRRSKREIKQRLFASKWLQDVYWQSEVSFHPSSDFEEVDVSIGKELKPAAKVIAFYLPQFHEFSENNLNWGKGFTEWTNLSRAIPRFPGHVAPRVPRDLGFYNLMEGDIQIRQAEMAKNAGVYGYCYYYYRFESKGFMDGPLERMLSDPRVDMPFCLMWCNETWTRAWVDQERTVIAEQKYSDSLDIDLVDDTSRIFKDPRYIKFNERPLFAIYRPSFLPDFHNRMKRLRDLFIGRHGFNPILALAETDAAPNLSMFEPEAAIEFTANKYNGKLRQAIDWSNVYSSSGGIYSYDELVDLSLADPIPPYQLARSVMPDWDKNPRRPGRGHVIHGSTPAKFEAWTKAIVDASAHNKFFGERVVFVNAWNEWAESAYLEPDTHRGGAYLNSLARAVFR